MGGYEKIIRELEKEFENHADSHKAAPMEKYMKNLFTYYGIKSPERKSISTPYIRELSKEHGDEHEEIIRAFWQHEKREFQYVGMEYFLRTKKHWTEKTIDCLENITINKSWWDTVDFIASNLVGHYMERFSPSNFKVMDQWNKDRNIWKIRTSILFQLKYKEKTDWDLLQEYILNHKSSKEFFIRKAMGWALREYSKTNEKEVRRFVCENPDLPGLTKREALKWLDKK